MLGGLGLIMQLAGGLAAVYMASRLGGQLFALFERGSVGGSIAITLLGLARSILHYHAGVQLVHGERPARAVRHYLVFAVIHTVAWIAYVSQTYGSAPRLWLPNAILFAVWPLTLAIALRVPSLRLVDDRRGARRADADLGGLAVLMVTLALMGAVIPAAMLLESGRIWTSTDGDANGRWLYFLTAIAFALRSLAHLNSSTAVMRRRSSVQPYVVAGSVTAVVLGAAWIYSTRKDPSLAIQTGGTLGLVLLVWPLTVYRTVRRPRWELDARSTLGWLVLGAGALLLAISLPGLLVGHDSMPSELDYAVLGSDLGHPFAVFGVATLQLWAGAELVGRTSRQRDIALGSAIVVLAGAVLYGRPVLESFESADDFAAVVLEGSVAAVATWVILPLVTIVLVLIPPRPRAGVGDVFE